MTSNVSQMSREACRFSLFRMRSEGNGVKLAGASAVAALALLLSSPVSVAAGPHNAIVAQRQAATAAAKRGDHAAAVRILRSLANQGDAFSQDALGNIYMRGKGVPKDKVEGVKWLRRAADQGYPDSQLILGLLYVMGEGVPEDFVLAHMWLSLASADRRSEVFKETAQKAMSTRRDIERAMTPSQIAEAEKLVRSRESAGQPDRTDNQKTAQAGRSAGSYADAYGDAEAAYNRGDYATALRFFRPMAAQGDAASQHAMGNMYSLGKGVPQNDAEAIKWFRLAADQGVPDSQFLLGMYHLHGRGVAKDYVLAHMWLSLAVVSGNLLGGHFKGAATKAANELRDVEKLMTQSQVAEARKLAQSHQSSRQPARTGKEQVAQAEPPSARPPAAAKPQADAVIAQQQQAVAAEKSGDHAAAARIHRSLAEQGDAFSQGMLASMYVLGRGVPQSHAEAAKWLRLSAEQGHPGSQYMLGLAYFGGRGVPQDYVVAYMWLSLAAAGQVSEALNVRRDLEKSMTPAQISEAQNWVRVRQNSRQPAGADQQQRTASVDPTALRPLVAFGNLSIRWQPENSTYVLEMKPHGGDGRVFIQCYTTQTAYAASVLPLNDEGRIDSPSDTQIVTVWSDRSQPVDLKFDAQHKRVAFAMDATGVAEWSVSTTREFIGILGAATKFFAYSIADRTATFDVMHMPAAKARFAELCKRPRF